MLCCHLQLFSKSTLSKILPGNYHQSVKQFGSRSGRLFVGPDLGPNCLLNRLLADDTSRQRNNSLCYYVSDCVRHRDNKDNKYYTRVTRFNGPDTCRLLFTTSGALTFVLLNLDKSSLEKSLDSDQLASSEAS